MSLVYYWVSADASINHFIPDFAVQLGWSTNLFYIPFYLMNLTISFAGGLLWYNAEKKAAKSGKLWYRYV